MRSALRVAAIVGAGALLFAAHARAGTGIWAPLSSGSQFRSSAMVYRGGAAWFATAVTTPGGDYETIRIYRRRGHRWTLDGLVRPRQFPCLTGGPFAVSLTSDTRPDFTIRCGGADTPWYAVIGYLRRQWRLVPFDFGTSPQVAVTAVATVGHRVHMWLNAGGCASCVDSAAWYGFDRARSIFVAVEPPGGTLRCRPSDVRWAAAYGWTGDRALQAPGNLHGKFVPQHLACDDGWAVASGTLNGRPRLALYEQVGRSWRKDAVAPPATMNAYATGTFVLPQSLYARLARRIEASIAPIPRDEGMWGGRIEAHGPWGFRKPSEKPVWIEIGPRMSFGAAEDVDTRSGRWRALATRARRRVRLWIYQWRDRAWRRRARVALHFPPVSNEVDGVQASLDRLTPAKAPDFVIEESYGDPIWKAVVSDVGRRWHVLPFRINGQARSFVPGAEYEPVMSAVAVLGRSWAALARYRHGVLVPNRSSRVAQPECSVATLARLSGTRVRFVRAVCAFGFAAARGRTRLGRPYVTGYVQNGTFWELIGNGPTINRVGYGEWAPPDWVLRDLRRQLG